MVALVDFWTSSFWRDLNEGDINFRDNLQFELKSRFPLHSKKTKNVFKQEIYMFIPETLQIEGFTYLKDFFYMDQTNLIRYQTPVLSLSELINPQCRKSPFFRLTSLQNKAAILEELQLFGSIFRSALRARIRKLVINLKNPHDTKGIQSLLVEIEAVRSYFHNFKQEFKAKVTDEELLKHIDHIDEYFVDTIQYYLTGYLDRLQYFHVEAKETENQICNLLIEIEDYRKEYHLMANPYNEKEIYQESILHRLSLLNKFVMESLKLKTDRIALQEKYGQALGAVAAGIAMFVYMTLFALALFASNSPSIISTSFPIILIAVVLYILKDRLKEGLKTLYQRKAFRWFPDYTTKIENPEGEYLGMLKENFSFITEDELPHGFLHIRNKEFHEDLPAIKRHDSIMEYKREVQLYYRKTDNRRKDLNTIFRFNVHRFIEKANDSIQTYLTLNPDTRDLVVERLPKVYHLNIIIRNTYQNSKCEIAKFRVVIDKTGIKRVEKIT